MASVINRPEGNRWVQYADQNGKRQTLRLGRMSKGDATTICSNVERLLGAKVANREPALEVLQWVAELGDVLRAKLDRLRLLPGVAKPQHGPGDGRLGDFLDRYIKARTDVKPRTKINLEHAKGELVKFFGAERSIASISPADADLFRLKLLERLGDNTVRRTCGRAKQFFRFAVRKRLIGENPFGDMKGCSVRANKDRFYFVTVEDIRRVLDYCDLEWKVIVALARFGGLRVPSEVLALKWGHIDWAASRITIPQPKVERHEGRAVRVIPLFPELAPILREAFEAAPPKTEFVIRRYRSASSNLRTELGRIIIRAGLQPWGKLFQNMRSTRETELARQYPLHNVVAWLGNSQPVAMEHYLQTTASDFERAAAEPTCPILASGGGPPEKAKHNPKHSGVISGATASESELGDAPENDQNSAELCVCETPSHVVAKTSLTYSLPPRGVEPLFPD